MSQTFYETYNYHEFPPTKLCYIRSIIDMMWSIQIKSWAIKCMEKHSGLISMVDSYWAWGQSETTALIGRFQSGDQKGRELEIS